MAHPGVPSSKRCTVARILAMCWLALVCMLICHGADLGTSGIEERCTTRPVHGHGPLPEN
eukprot:9502779-Karenia_brevis.AAC.1